MGFALPAGFADFASDVLPDAPVAGAVAIQGLVLTDLGVIFVEPLFLGITSSLYNLPLTSRNLAAGYIEQFFVCKRLCDPALLDQGGEQGITAGRA